MKLATVIALLLDCEVLRNYRPVSNLGYVPKLLEKVVDERTTLHCKDNKLEEILHSAYIKCGVDKIRWASLFSWILVPPLTLLITRYFSLG